MEVSVIVTAINEDSELIRLVSSFENQSRKPNEIVIVDGGSPVGVIKELTEAFRDNPRVRFLTPGRLNISQGRNFAIKEASHNVIAVTDCGCSLDRDWLDNIVSPFEEESVTVVSGWYLPNNESDFEEILSSITFLTLREKSTEEFVPSARSLAFRKEVWKSIGGFPEELLHC